MIPRILAAFLMFGGAAAAQEVADTAAPAGSVVFHADFFAPFRPRTALDMVERVPGFTLDEGEERRGLAGAAGNVLIDGALPTAKSQGIEDILARIPASDVVRIELVRGAGSNAANAQSARVNVVRAIGGGEGVWELSLEAAEDGRISPVGEASWSGRRGVVEYGIATVIDLDHSPFVGERRDYDTVGALQVLRIERIPANEREARLSGEVTLPLLGGTASLTGELSRAEVDERLRSTSFDLAQTIVGFDDADEAEREDTLELGANFTRDIGAWSAELAAIATRRQFDADETSTERDADGALDERAHQTQSIASGETIVRAVAHRDVLGDWRLELGAEAALNTLEQNLALTEDTGAGPVPILLPSANVRVEEARAEPFFTLARQITPLWLVETGAAVEASRISLTGDAERETDLVYWKPSLQLIRRLGARNQMRLRAYRDVGQLDFENFVSAADIQDSQVDAGNPDLRPETSWRYEIAGDWRFGEDGALGVTLYHWAIEDALDVVPVGPIGDQFDAPGNIGDASANGIRVSLTMPLTFPPNSEFRVEGFAQSSEVTDPLTGETRSLSEFEATDVTLAFRQDVPSLSLAWGLDFDRDTAAPSYRLDQISHEQDGHDLVAWIETSAFAGVKLRIWGSHLTDDPETRERRFFTPDRAGAFDGSEDRSRHEGRYFGISASGSF